jgi:exodeoxyribonuclease VII small subunit
MAKKKTKTDSDAELNFEEAIDQIQEIARQFDEGELGLDESLERFETGVRLLRKCHSKLDRAEQRIKVLTDVDADGNPLLSDFDDSSTLEQNQQSAGRRKKSKPASPEEKPSESDESSLF